ncbi:uncharacterized protein B0P05DRAFT_98294 [Gilbertella persicaria]|uniref:Uncharacterized protein n=1 Tax=Rhizopus stolonifer TaxID=4846 RepID=A0A367KRB9_RHIST|nr:uncharacterized protein B0P05DRAFT_98294 [Gilbertella persicaria]KAI8097968.1 hypothetical protein B0P05DRAFT_98294 [Gilbertella persicaria]RCI04687.1 hypothetical protein CU098_011266 [Rhizopus stolonifer]
MTFDQYSSVHGKVAVLTGAASGIGKAVADTLVKLGAKVVIGDLNQELGQSVIDTYNKEAGAQVAAFMRVDVTKYSDNKALFQLAEQAFGGVDIAFLNAGIGEGANSMFGPLDDEKDERIFDVNTISIIKGTKVALLHMAKRGGGVIVNTASVAGFYSSPFISSYAASKFAVVGYTRSFALMPQICNVRVNAICPYWVETPLLINITDEEKHKDEPSFVNIIKHSPKTPIHTVVEAFLTLIIDETRNTQTLLALPTGVQVMDPPAALDGTHNEASLNAIMQFKSVALDQAKANLAAAMKAYGF